MQTLEETAAEWWTEQLRGPVHNDNGEAYQSVFGSLIANMYPAPTEAQLATFKDELVARLTQELARCGTQWYTIGVDYDPCRVLAEAADAANINYARFPWKTHLYVIEGKLEVSSGYGQPHTQL